MIGTDYRGKEVLAAYEPMMTFGLGVVVKIDLAEIRAPFIRAGTTAGIVALVLAIISSIAFVRVSAPIIRQIDESEERLQRAYDAVKVGAWEWDLQTNKNTWSDGVWTLYGLEPRSGEPSYELWRQSIHPEDRAAAEAAVKSATEQGTELNAEWRNTRGRTMADVRGCLSAPRARIVRIWASS
jgi:PAS domain-containing protein